MTGSYEDRTLDVGRLEDIGGQKGSAMPSQAFCNFVSLVSCFLFKDLSPPSHLDNYLSFLLAVPKCQYSTPVPGITQEHSYLPTKEMPSTPCWAIGVSGFPASKTASYVGQASIMTLYTLYNSFRFLCQYPNINPYITPI